MLIFSLRRQGIYCLELDTTSFKFQYVMIFSKKWKFCLFGCLLFFACKSGDCGCPMAENKGVEEVIQKDSLEQQKSWKKIAK